MGGQMRLLVIMLLALSVGCASMDYKAMKASGDSSATKRTCSTQTFYTDGTEKSCENMREETVVGGQGGDNFYKMVGTIAGLFLSTASIVIQALR